MPRKPKTIPGPSRLSQVLVELKKSPTLSLVGLRRLSLTLAAKNDHFGARHFVKEELPRIRYANPDLSIEVRKLPKNPGEAWKPEMILEFETGIQRIIDMDKKWSTSIVQELMDHGGGNPWKEFKAEALAAGLPLFTPAQKPRQPITKTRTRTPRLKSVTEIGRQQSDETNSELSLSPPDPPKTGAAAVLP